MTINLGRGTIDISFAYNPELNDLVKKIPDRQPHREDGRFWWQVPATPWHARQTIKIMGDRMVVGPDVHHLAKKDTFNHLHSDFEIDPLPGDIAPYPYQLVAVEFLNRINGRGIIADEVGCGKTPESILWARHKRLTKILVVCPASILYKWERELKRWYPEAGHLVQVIDTGRQPIKKSILVMSYDIMVSREQELCGKFDLIIYDELTRLKNHKTRRAKSAKQISLGTPYIIGLSGTPIMNRPMELYNILHMLSPKAYNWYSYANRYCLTAEKGYQGAKNLEELEDRLRGIMLRRFKREVSDQLPPLTRTMVPLMLTSAQRKVYDRLYDEDPFTIHQEFPGSKGYFVNSLDWLGAMRQWLERVRAKHVAEWAEDFLDASDDRKLVIYCGYKSSVVALEDYLYKFGTTKITGDDSNRERQVVIDRWQNSTDERVMLLTSAGGEGIDLFGKNGIDCSTILFAGREWSPAIEEQIEGRLDRTGQEYPVEAVYLVMEGTIDEDINTLIEAKRAIVRSAIRLDKVPTVTSDLLSLLEKRGKSIRTRREE
jgi:SWI/SNF-related matrix-associated actin-dependent regulator 1 of chromatin subfamily A